MIMNGRGVGGGCIRFPFTAAQWQELEQQALIFKYMLSGVPVPPHLLHFTPRRTSSSSSLGAFPHHPITLPSSHSGWRCFEMGRKIDPEPGRCRRTDGKKWRCSKEAFQDSKYCEKHMHRGKNRSRKPVEQQQQHVTTINTTSSLTSSSLTSDNHHHLCQPPAYSKLSSYTHLGLQSASSYQSSRFINSIHGRSSREDDDSWQLTPLAMSSSNSKKTAHHPYLDTSSSCSKLGLGHHHQKMFESTRRDDDDQQHPTVYRFLEEGPPEKKDSNSSWLNLDDKSSTTQLSISIPASAAAAHVFPIFNNSRPPNNHSQT